jgi:hypothetical protein
MGRPRLTESETYNVSCVVSEETYNAIIALAERQSITVSATCRELIMEALERRLKGD